MITAAKDRMRKTRERRKRGVMVAQVEISRGLRSTSWQSAPMACGGRSGIRLAEYGVVPRPPMETREVLLNADRVSVVFERLPDGKIRV